MGSAKRWFKWSQALLSMLLVQIFATAMQLLSKVILNDGTFVFALMTYRHIVAALCVAPLAFYFERGIGNKLKKWSVWFWLFTNALAGITLAMGLYYYGLRDTSATYSINFLNLIPVTTFIISTLAGMEKLRLKKWSSKAKVLGTIIAVGGALTTTLYKGKAFYIGQHSQHSHPITAHASKAHWIRGTFFLVGSCLSYTAWYILQIKLLKVLPLKYWATMLTCIIASVQSAIVGLCLDRSKASWKLGWNLQLFTIFYSGAFATAATFCLITWVISIRGPTYPPMFNPLALVFVALSEAIILGDALRVGTLLGMSMIIVGLYAFLWGKMKEIITVLPQANVAAGEVTTDSAANQSTSVVMPSTSPNTCVIEIEKEPDRNSTVTS